MTISSNPMLLSDHKESILYHINNVLNNEMN